MQDISFSDDFLLSWGRKTTPQRIWLLNKNKMQLVKPRTALEILKLEASESFFPSTLHSTFYWFMLQIHLACILELIFRGWKGGNPFTRHRPKPEISCFTVILSETADSIFKACRQSVGFLALTYIYISKSMKSVLRDFSWVIPH